MSAAPWTVGRYVVETLAANGIDTVFGIPGVHNIELYRGLELARVRHVLELCAIDGVELHQSVSAARPAALATPRGVPLLNLSTSNK